MCMWALGAWCDVVKRAGAEKENAGVNVLVGAGADICCAASRVLRYLYLLPPLSICTAAPLLLTANRTGMHGMKEHGVVYNKPDM